MSSRAAENWSLWTDKRFLSLLALTAIIILLAEQLKLPLGDGTGASPTETPPPPPPPEPEDPKWPPGTPWHLQKYG